MAVKSSWDSSVGLRARRPRTMKQCSVDARSEAQPSHPIEEEGDTSPVTAGDVEEGLRIRLSSCFGCDGLEFSGLCGAGADVAVECEAPTAGAGGSEA